MSGVLKKDDNGYPVMGGVSSADSSTVLNAEINPVTGGLLVTATGSGGTGTWYSVSGTIDGNNVTFTIAATPSSDILLFLARQPQMKTDDFTFSGSTITYAVAPDASLSGQPHWAFVIS